MKKLAGFLAGLIALGCLAIGYMYSVAIRDPVVRRVTVEMPDWPAGAPPLHVALLADLHVGGPDMPPSRVRRIVREVNSLGPALVLLAGDFTSDKRLMTKHYGGSEAIAPLAGLKAPLGGVAVLGNHDHWRGLGDIVPSLRAAHVRVLDNNAMTIGPLDLGGVDDAFTGHDDVAATVRSMRRLPGAKILLSHSPDIVPAAPPDISLILAGHTHCGQIRLPLIGAVSYVSRYGAHFACGLSRDGPKRVVTTAGLGTSVLPLRLGAVPDLWLLTLVPSSRNRH